MMIMLQAFSNNMWQPSKNKCKVRSAKTIKTSTING
ncbi:hypothetical protein ACHAXM_004125 [Skeletonema potamos]